VGRAGTRLPRPARGRHLTPTPSGAQGSDRLRTGRPAGPTLRAVLEVNPEAVAIAAALDEERRRVGARGRLLGLSATPAAVAGYPHVTVPAGFVGGLPVGLSFFAGAWQEGRLLAYAHAFERAADARRSPAFPEHLP